MISGNNCYIYQATHITHVTLSSDKSLPINTVNYKRDTRPYHNVECITTVSPSLSLTERTMCANTPISVDITSAAIDF